MLGLAEAAPLKMTRIETLLVNQRLMLKGMAANSGNKILAQYEGHQESSDMVACAAGNLLISCEATLCEGHNTLWRTIAS